jgi:hypothetical protein
MEEAMASEKPPETYVEQRFLLRILEIITKKPLDRFWEAQSASLATVTENDLYSSPRSL